MLYAIEVIQVLLLLLKMQLLQRVVHRRLVTPLGCRVAHANNRREKVLILDRDVTSVGHIDVQRLIRLDR